MDEKSPKSPPSVFSSVSSMIAKLISQQGIANQSPTVCGGISGIQVDFGAIRKLKRKNKMRKGK